VDSTPIQLEIQVDLSNDTIFHCPNKTGLFEDDSICNIYHECVCTDNGQCTLANSYICPENQVFSKEKTDCEPIEKHGCSTNYFQFNDTVVSNETKPLRPVESPKTSNFRMGFNPKADDSYDDHFKCPPGANNRYADSLICNIFHVCVTKGDSTYDQPFLCPYASIFRVVNSTHMYCDKRRYDTDCNGKAFYKDTNDEGKKRFSSKLMLNSTKNSSLCKREDEFFEDQFYCNAYHRCLDDVDELYMCDNQLLFNPLSGLCDYAINVDCDRKQILKHSNETTTTSTTKANDSKPVTKPNEPSARTQTKSDRLAPFFIFGIKIDLNCPGGAQNVLLADSKFCNVFHHCHTTSGNVFVCEKGQVFDTSANGPNSSGVCNFEESVDCSGKFILTENGIRAGKTLKPSARMMMAPSNMLDMHHFAKESVKEDLVSGIQFDCQTKPAGHWRDTRFCDIYHACINGQQKKTYKCAQISERVYFDEQTKRYGLSRLYRISRN
jgi:hypothetical protein